MILGSFWTQSLHSLDNVKLKFYSSPQMMEETYCSAKSAHHASVLKGLHEMQQNQQLCDFELRCNDGGSVSVHKCVVTAASGFLRVMMEISAASDFNVPCKQNLFDCMHP